MAKIYNVNTKNVDFIIELITKFYSTNLKNKSIIEMQKIINLFGELSLNVIDIKAALLFMKVIDNDNDKEFTDFLNKIKEIIIY